jgi:uncharacterized protein YkwD
MVFSVVALALLWPVVGDHIQAAVTPDRDGCAHTSDLPKPSTTAQARTGVLCLLNHHRAARGLPPLREDSRLQDAAQAHAEDMGRRDFYAHRNPDGLEPDTRIRSTGFEGRLTGENIHWGVGINATPARIVDDWMNSPGHRANILRRSYTHVGTGIGYDSPEALSRERAGVYVNNFGG